MEQGKSFSSGQNTIGDTWYVDNYVLLKDYYDMTISRIAARCIRSGNIAIEEYKHYAYILDVLEEISETGEYIVAHPDLYSYVDRKIAGGINELKRNLREFKSELEHNASPEMVHQDKNELNKLKEALGVMDKTEDPTVGAGMSMDDVVNKLMQENHIQMPSSQQPQAQPAQPRPQPAQPQAQPAQPRPQPAQPQAQSAQPRPQPAQPQAQSAQPRPQSVQPQAQPAQPRPQPVQPQAQPAQPRPQPAQPRPQPAQPQAQPAQPRPQYTEKPQG